MIVCPDCGHENISGTDECQQCHQSLTSLSRPRPASGIERSLSKDPIALLSPKSPLTVGPNEPVGRVLRTLVEKSIGCVIVVEDGNVTGIFSERDALMRLNVNAAQLANSPISEFMTPSPETLQMDDKIAFALHKMDLGGYRHIPILTDGKIAGVISIRDILAYMTDKVAS